MVTYPQTPPWVQHLSDDDLIATAGHETLAAGQDLADHDAVTDVVVGDHSRMLLGSVQADRSMPYQTMVRSISGEPGSPWFGTCSCQVTSNCEHAVALLLVMQRGPDSSRAPGSDQDWDTHLDPLIREIQFSLREGGARDRPARQLGLDLSEINAAGTIRSRRLSLRGDKLTRRWRLRPVIQGRSGRWVRSGLTWDNIASPLRDENLSLSQQLALTSLHSAIRTRTSRWVSPEDLFLDEIGPSGWLALRQAVASGVALVTTGEWQVDLATTGDIAVDLSENDDGSVGIVPLMRVGGLSDDPIDLGLDQGHEIVLEGDPPAGAVIRNKGEKSMVLAPLTSEPDPALRDVLAGGMALRVPAKDVERLLDEYVPVLRRRVEVVSRDASVDIPEAVRPQLAVIVTAKAGHEVSVAARFRYGTNGSHNDVFADDALPGPIPRDPIVEQHLQARAEASSPFVSWLLSGPGGERHLAGMDTVTFVEDDLPALRANEAITVDVNGELGDFRAATATPVVAIQDATGESTDWFDLKVSVTVEDQQIPFEHIVRAFAGGDARVLLESGIHVSLDIPELQPLRELVEEARALPDTEADTIRVSRYHTEALDGLRAVAEIDEVAAAEWERGIQSLLDIADRPTPPLPAGLDAHLRPYQLEGFRWLSALWDASAGGILADDMGLGKTLQSLAVIARHKELAEAGGRAADLSPTLVVCPTSVIGTWVEEARRFTPGIRVAVLEATGKRRSQPLTQIVADADIVVTSYAIMRLDQDDLAQLDWDALILDEAQFVKNPSTATYRAARAIRAPRRIAMTGTPVENSLRDLWSIMSLVTPGLLPAEKAFVDKYRKPIEDGADNGPQMLAELRNRIRPFILRRAKEIVEKDLPPKQEQYLHVELSPAHRRLYDRQLQRERQRVMGLLDDMGRNRVTVLSSLTRLRQLALDASLVVAGQEAAQVPSSKLDALVQHLGEAVSEGHRVLVFSQFTGYLEIVRERLTAEGFDHLYLDGSTRNRAGVVADFRAGKAPVFCISLKAGGFGLTLTEADYVFVLDPWWNPAAEAQAVDRTHRIGQHRNVVVYRMVATGTIEEKVVALQERKRNLVGRVMSGDDVMSSPLSAEDVRSLLD